MTEYGMQSEAQPIIIENPNQDLIDRYIDTRSNLYDLQNRNVSEGRLEYNLSRIAHDSTTIIAANRNKNADELRVHLEARVALYEQELENEKQRILDEEKKKAERKKTIAKFGALITTVGLGTVLGIAALQNASSTYEPEQVVASNTPTVTYTAETGRSATPTSVSVGAAIKIEPPSTHTLTPNVPTLTLTQTPTRIPTETFTAAPTGTPSSTATETATRVPTETPTPVPTSEPVVTGDFYEMPVEKGKRVKDVVNDLYNGYTFTDSIEEKKIKTLAEAIIRAYNNMPNSAGLRNYSTLQVPRQDILIDRVPGLINAPSANHLFNLVDTN
ncbi:MAG: hypothetical protein M3Q80_02705, partial [bacterium]|nr:hypothetical protein [bacterium]